MHIAIQVQHACTANEKFCHALILIVTAPAMAEIFAPDRVCSRFAWRAYAR